MQIYTKQGDKGKTKTFYGEMSKSDALAEALGSVDELNSWIGVCRSQIFNFQFSITNELSKSKFSITDLDQELRRVQNNLLTLGSELAGSPPSPRLRKDLEVEVRRLEKLIDKLTGEMPALANFIYPVGQLQVVRAVCRRAEREIVRYMNYDLRFMNGTILKYMNRLSDALFTMGRWVNYKTGVKEEVWK